VPPFLPGRATPFDETKLGRAEIVILDRDGVFTKLEDAHLRGLMCRLKAIPIPSRDGCRGLIGHRSQGREWQISDDARRGPMDVPTAQKLHTAMLGKSAQKAHPVFQAALVLHR